LGLAGLANRARGEEMTSMDLRRSTRLLPVVAVLALVLVPGLVSAGQPVPFSASGVYTLGAPAWSISEGDVKPAGKSGRFVVKNREVTGFLNAGSGAVDLSGPFSLDFGDNVPLATQSGQIHGTFTFGDPTAPTATAAVHAGSQATGPLVLSLLADGTPVAALALRVTGGFTFTAGSIQGNGSFTADVLVGLNADGHIVGLIPTGMPTFDLGVFAQTGNLVPIGTATTQLELDGTAH
jgi:hypothetical protein